MHIKQNFRAVWRGSEPDLIRSLVQLNVFRVNPFVGDEVEGVADTTAVGARGLDSQLGF